MLQCFKPTCQATLTDKCMLFSTSFSSPRRYYKNDMHCSNWITIPNSSKLGIHRNISVSIMDIEKNHYTTIYYSNLFCSPEYPWQHMCTEVHDFHSLHYQQNTNYTLSGKKANLCKWQGQWLFSRYGCPWTGTPLVKTILTVKNSNVAFIVNVSVNGVLYLTQQQSAVRQITQYIY